MSFLRLTKISKSGSTFKLWLLGLTLLFEGLVVVFSLGFVTSDLYTDLLFSDFMEDK